MELKTKEFWNAMFLKMLGSTRDENGRLYSNVYRHECLDILNEVKEQLQAIIDRFGGYGTENVYRAFVDAFTHKLPKYKVKEYSLKECADFDIIVNQFDKLYGKDFDLTYAFDDMLNEQNPSLEANCLLF